MKKILICLVALSLLAGAASVLAEDTNLLSAGVTPDSPVYFLKTWKETIQTFLTFNAENKFKQYMHLAEVRLAEYQKMIEKGKTEIAQKTLDKYQKQLDRAIQKITELENKGKDVKDLSQELSTTTLKHIYILEQNFKKVPESGQQGIENALDAIRKGIKTRIQSLKEKTCTSSGGIATTSSCCKGGTDFPNLCLIGACGCSPDNSESLTVCDCGEGKCFNGTECIAVSQ